MDVLRQLGIKSFSKDQIDEFAAKVSAYAVCKDVKDLQLESEQVSREMTSYPFMLFPCPFPKRLFYEALKLEKDFHVLFHKISQDHEFLKEHFEGSKNADPSFIGRIYDIYEKTRQEGISQPLSFSLFRLDYMLEQVEADNNEGEKFRLANVEFNDMPGAVIHGERMTHLFSYALGLLDNDVPNGSQQIPLNRCFEASCDVMATAWEYYGSKDAIILSISPDIDDDGNLFCKRIFELHFQNRNPRIKSIRRSFSSLIKTARLDKNRRLFVEDYEVAIAYYRTGHRPECYISEEHWELRHMIERSHAIKVPSLAIRLTLGKSIQQKLCEPSILERFLTDKGQIERIRKTFKEIYNFKGANADETLKLAVENPDNYVLKPDIDGGGNNFFGDEIRTKLLEMTPLERTGYILMEKINYPHIMNYIVHPNNPDTAELNDVFTELGIFGVILSSGETILVNQDVGYVMRTKARGVLDGGVSTGSAFYDNPYLV